MGEDIPIEDICNEESFMLKLKKIFGFKTV